jgi:hypothetical protein
MFLQCSYLQRLCLVSDGNIVPSKTINDKASKFDNCPDIPNVKGFSDAVLKVPETRKLKFIVIYLSIGIFSQIKKFVFISTKCILKYFLKLTTYLRNVAMLFKF